ncbi:LAS1-like [Perkinsus chesapeaki]|uniref:LAS1-like n=1 Tax=Perkinsus chesapeaki TaxID=330153 RepID=A0A7J6M0M1_PERCH|nr:LAS1-like [Perkinsus chesapeaki]
MRHALLEHLEDYGLHSLTDVKFEEERQALMAELFRSQAPQLEALRNAIDTLIEKKLTAILLNGSSDKSALVHATDLAANAAVALLYKLKRVGVKIFLPRLAAARPNSRLRRILWDRVLLDDNNNAGQKQILKGRPVDITTVDDAIKSSGVALSQRDIAEVKTLVMEGGHGSEPSTIYTAIVLVLVYGIHPLNHERYKKLAIVTDRWDRALKSTSQRDGDSGHDGRSWLSRRFLDGRLGKECTELIWDQLILATHSSEQVLANLTSLCMSCLLPLLNTANGALSGEALHASLRARRTDIIKLVCGAGVELQGPSRSLPARLPTLGQQPPQRPPPVHVDAAIQSAEEVPLKPPCLSDDSLRYAEELIKRKKASNRIGLELELHQGQCIGLPLVNPFGLQDSVAEIADSCLVNEGAALLASSTVSSLRHELLEAVAVKFEGDSRVVDDRSTSASVARVKVKIGFVETTLSVNSSAAPPDSKTLLDVCMRAVGRAELGLSGQTIEEKLKAVALIDFWRIRGRVPVAVDCTGMILQIMCHDPYFYPTTTAQVSVNELQQLYSLAVIRLCNGVIDTEQRGQVAESQDAIARRIGFPTWLVELRHEATHGSTLPTIHILRMAAESILRYLDTNYWSRQYAELESHGVFSANDTDGDYGVVRLSRSDFQEHCTMLRKKLASLGRGVGVTEAVKYFNSVLKKVASKDDIRDMFLDIARNIAPTTDKGGSAVDVAAGSLQYLELKRPGLGQSLVHSLLTRADDSVDGKRFMEWFEALSDRSAISCARDVCFKMMNVNPFLVTGLGNPDIAAAFSSNERLADDATLNEIEDFVNGLENVS